MSLIDELRDLGKLIPPSHLPSVGEMAGVVGALIAKVEHGEQVFSDTIKNDAQKLSDLLGGVAADPAPEPAPVTPPPTTTPSEPVSAPLPADPPATDGSPVLADTAAQIASLVQANQDLQQQLQTALAALSTSRANNDLAAQAAAPTSTVVAS